MILSISVCNSINILISNIIAGNITSWIFNNINAGNVISWIFNNVNAGITLKKLYNGKLYQQKPPAGKIFEIEDFKNFQFQFKKINEILRFTFSLVNRISEN